MVPPLFKDSSSSDSLKTLVSWKMNDVGLKIKSVEL